MAEPSGDGANVHSGSQQAGCDVVPEVVQANTGGAGTLDQQAEGAGRGVGPPRCRESASWLKT